MSKAKKPEGWKEKAVDCAIIVVFCVGAAQTAHMAFSLAGLIYDMTIDRIAAEVVRRQPHYYHTGTFISKVYEIQ